MVALGAVLCLGLGKWQEIGPAVWVGMAFYFVCYIMYLKALVNALFKMKKVTADLLVLTVMTVSFLAGQALSGAWWPGSSAWALLCPSISLNGPGKGLTP